MGPKIDACRRFVTSTRPASRHRALSDTTAILTGTAGTTISAVRADAIPGSSLT
jgi:carbamate kinase